MRMTKLAVPWIAAVTLSVAVLVSGCGPIRYQPPLPLSIRESGEGMEVAVCESISSTRVYVGVRNAATDGEWLTLSDLKGSTVIEAESVFNVGESLAGMPAVVDHTSWEPFDGEDVSVSIQGDSDGEGSLTVFFAQVPWNDLDGDWFFTDGGRSTDPCGHFQEWILTH